MGKRIFVLLMCIHLMYYPLYAQYYYYNNKYYDNTVVLEVGGGIGLMNALTDLGGKKGTGKGFIKDLNGKNARPCFNLYLAAMFKDVIALRIEGDFGKVTGYDSILKDVKASTFGRYERNLSFKSNITDFQLAVELHPLFFKTYDDNQAPYFSPYIVAGVGYFSFNPQAKLNGQWYALQPLHTEGQGFAEYPDHKPYKLNQVNVAAGIGLKYEVNSFLNARVEINHRFLRTDYLDDVSTIYIDPSLFSNYLSANKAAVAQQLYSRKSEITPGDVTISGSQRGNPKDNDAFFSVKLKIGMTLGRQRR